jgi:hypothetical protein
VVVGDHEQGLVIALVRQFEHVDDLLGVLAVQVACGFIRQDQGGAVDQGAALLGDKQTACYYLEQAAQDASLKAEAESLLELLD